MNVVVWTGLEFVVEIHVPNGGALKYECEVCEAKFDGNVKFSHLTGVKHRHTVIVSTQQTHSSVLLILIVSP